MEARINGKLKGYTVQVGKVHFHPLSFSLDLKDLSLVQNAAPDPPIADIGKLHASVHWRELLRARLVGDFLHGEPEALHQPEERPQGGREQGPPEEKRAGRKRFSPSTR